MSVIVSDTGFAKDDWTYGIHAADGLADIVSNTPAALALDLPNDFDVTQLRALIDQIDLIRIDFPSSADGRGFSLARHLRMLGYQGRLRACGHVLADHYAMARRSGFDEVEISADLASRQPENQWIARANWQDHDYQQRLRQFD